jgi:ribose 5-phosphate isomerase B
VVADLAGDPRVGSLRDYSDEFEPESPYPYVAIRIAEAVAAGEIDRGILVCGTGIGMSIAANKVGGVRAAVVHDCYSAERSVLSNNCQIMTLGSRVIAPVAASRLVREWLAYHFDETSPSAEKVRVIESYEAGGPLTA